MSQVKEECSPGKTLNVKTKKCTKTKKARIKKECAPGKTRNPETNRCNKTKDKRISHQTKTKKARTIKECPPGKTRNPETNRCIKTKDNKKSRRESRSQSVSLTVSQQADFDNMLHIMRQPVGKRPHNSHSPLDLHACLAKAPIAMLREEMTRRGFKSHSPTPIPERPIHILIPRKKKPKE